MSFAHIPTILLLIGFPAYWLDLYVLPHAPGCSSWVATGVFLVFSVIMVAQRAINLKQARCQGNQVVGHGWQGGWLLGMAGVLGVMVLAVICYASILPPHLPQEFDAINYHITLPRQHLFIGSFAHLPWSVADLYFLPIDYALAPFWLATALPNKFPQFLFFLGLLGVVARLVYRFAATERRVAAGWAVVAVMGSHAIGIQAGTAMLDLVACYLFFAALDSLLSDQPGWAALEFAFFFWSKSFMPFFVTAALGACVILCWVFMRWGHGEWAWAFSKDLRHMPRLKKFWLAFGVISIIIAGPFMARSLQYAGTLVYPFACGEMDRRFNGSSVCHQATAVQEAKDSYGTGRGLKAFLEQWWFVAVPERGVNNRFDYPLGLTFLIFLAPFIVFITWHLRNKVFPLLPVFCVVYWLLWWCGSQQSRFVFIPLVGMIITTIPALASLGKLSGVLRSALMISLMLTSTSIVRAHKADWGKSSFAVLREEDKRLLRQAAGIKAGEIVTMDRIDLAFAPFPVQVKGFKSEFVIEQK